VNRLYSVTAAGYVWRAPGAFWGRIIEWNEARFTGERSGL
jgi:hypothetical protein